MRYTFLLYSSESDFADATPEQMAAQKAAYGEYIGALRAAGVLVDTDWLQPTPTATTITLRDGERRVQDGPFADTKEQLGGYFVVDVPNLDAAIEWAEKSPAAKHGLVEIRPSAMGGG
ncbi:MAG: YciI family protein [Myxococcota bacterium]